MATLPVSDSELIRTTAALNQTNNNIAEAARLLGLSRGGVQSRIEMIRRRNIDLPKKEVVPIEFELRDRIRSLESALNESRHDALDAARVRSEIFKIADSRPKVPNWTVVPKRAHAGLPGVPTLFLSDFHWGEVVRGEEIGGVNDYNITIANARLRSCVERTIYLLKHHIVNPEYPGIVVCLGGDMISGDIHEELALSNDKPIMPALLDLFGALTWALAELQQAFGNVFVVCVTGNHGRNTRKIHAKRRHWTSFDWLLYQFLEKRFESCEGMTFLIPDGPDAHYSIYGHRYCLNHGDRLGHGGDGMIGSIGPIQRGNKKKQSRNAAIGLTYDTLLIGHWHQYMPGLDKIVNGSLKGYDEYANSENFGYEVPTQALWMTHYERGITMHLPVYLGDHAKREAVKDWIRWAA